MKRFYGLLKTTFILPFLLAAINGQSQCGNNASKGATNCGCTNCPGDPFEPYVGNEFRRVKDLEVWGGVGEIPLVWMRYGYSRYGGFLYQYGHSHNWNSSFNYNMSDAGVNEKGQPLLYVHYAEGGSTYFVRDARNPQVWAAVHEVDKTLFQDGNNFYLQMANGHRYRFEKLSGSNGSFYQLQDIRDSKQNLYKLTYDNRHLLMRVTEPAGRYLQITQDTVFSIWRVITKVSTSDGRSVRYNYDLVDDGLISSLSLTSVDYGDGTKAQYTYSQSEPGSRPNLEHAIDPRYEGTDVNMKFTYDNDNVWGFIKEEKNGITEKVMATLTAEAGKRTVCYANGRVQVYNMPDEMVGKARSYIDGLGRKTEYDYQNEAGFLKSQKDALGRTTTYNSLTAHGNPLEITHADGSKEKWTRDEFDQVLTYTDELGRETMYTRDARNRITRINYPDGTKERFTYNNFGEVVTHTRQNGAIESNVYNNRGLKTGFIDAEGNLTQYTYDNADRQASVRDGRGNITRTEYNERGLLTKLTNADGSFQTYGYDDFGNRVSVINEIGNTWTTIYDEFKRRDSLVDPLGRLTIYRYDLPGNICGCSHDNGKPTSIVSPSGKTTKIEYDVEWQMLSETAGAGSPDEATTFYEYDQIGNLVTVIDPRKKSWITEYDERNRRKSSIDPLNHKIKWTYDITGNVVNVIRPDSGITAYTYDEMNRVTQMTDQRGQLTKMKFDDEGNLIKLTDPKGRNYNFQYDLLNRQTRLLYPGGSFEAYTYDQAGNVKTHINQAGAMRTYTYDNRNREITSAWSDNTPSITSSYDAANRLLILSSSVSELTYTYTNADELASESQNISGSQGAKKLNYNYNIDGLQNEMIYPDGTIIKYSYTGRNQVKTIADGGTVLAAYAYDLNSNRIDKALKNGTNTEYAYDDINLVSLVNHKKGALSFARFEYGYDNLNRRAFVKRNSGKGDTYTYDATSQVSEVLYQASDPEGIPVNPLRKVTYDWDVSGNRIAVIDNGVQTNYVTNNRNQYINIDGNPLNYTGNGNLRTYKGWTFTYDAQDRLIRAQKGSVAAKFAYDAQNRCVRREVNNQVKFFYYDNWNLVEEASNTGIQLAQYIHGTRLDELIIKSFATDKVYYHEDALGSVTQLTDASGNIVEQYSYDVFGAATITGSAGNAISISAFANRFMFTGREFIQEMGLYDFRNRTYSAELGRFLQTDPMLFDAKDYNLYRYLFNNPVNSTDPLGLADDCCCACVTSVKIKNIQKINTAQKFGHSFDVVIELEYVKSEKTGDATLDWSEKVDPAPDWQLKDPKFKAGGWNDMYAIFPTSPTFDPWNKRKKPCPGKETVTITDPPADIFVAGTERQRKLDFNITVGSAPNCTSCKNKSLNVTATQLLKTSKDGKSAVTQDFKTP